MASAIVAASVAALALAKGADGAGVIGNKVGVVVRDGVPMTNNAAIIQYRPKFRGVDVLATSDDVPEGKLYPLETSDLGWPLDPDFAGKVRNVETRSESGAVNVVFQSESSKRVYHNTRDIRNMEVWPLSEQEEVERAFLSTDGSINAVMAKDHTVHVSNDGHAYRLHPIVRPELAIGYDRAGVCVLMPSGEKNTDSTDISSEETVACVQYDSDESVEYLLLQTATVDGEVRFLRYTGQTPVCALVSKKDETRIECAFFDDQVTTVKTAADVDVTEEAGVIAHLGPGIKSAKKFDNDAVMMPVLMPGESSDGTSVNAITDEDNVRQPVVIDETTVFDVQYDPNARSEGYDGTLIMAIFTKVGDKMGLLVQGIIIVNDISAFAPEETTSGRTWQLKIHDEPDHPVHELRRARLNGYDCYFAFDTEAGRVSVFGSGCPVDATDVWKEIEAAEKADVPAAQTAPSKDGTLEITWTFNALPGGEAIASRLERGIETVMCEQIFNRIAENTPGPETYGGSGSYDCSKNDAHARYGVDADGKATLVGRIAVRDYNGPTYTGKPRKGARELTDDHKDRLLRMLARGMFVGGVDRALDPGVVVGEQSQRLNPKVSLALLQPTTAAGGGLILIIVTASVFSVTILAAFLTMEWRHARSKWSSRSDLYDPLVGAEMSDGDADGAMGAMGAIAGGPSASASFPSTGAVRARATATAAAATAPSGSSMAL